MKYVRIDCPCHFESKDSDVITENDIDGGAGAGAPRKPKKDPSFSGVANLFGNNDVEPPVIKKTDNSDGDRVTLIKCKTWRTDFFFQLRFCSRF